VDAERAFTIRVLAYEAVKSPSHFFLLLAGTCSNSFAQDDRGTGQAGYGDVPDFGGPENVAGSLKQADEERDANAASGKFDLDTTRQGEWLKAAEVGWTPSFDQRKTHLVQLTYWDKDERTEAGIAGGSGWAFSAGVEIARPRGEAWTIGAGWAKPSEDTYGPGLDDETVIETSYKFQLAKNLSLLPDGQIIFNPANNPNKSSIWFIGVRAILTL
jgi:hypothetical protein